MMAEDLAVLLWPTGVPFRRRAAGELEELAGGLLVTAQKDNFLLIAIMVLDTGTQKST